MENISWDVCFEIEGSDGQVLLVEILESRGEGFRVPCLLRARRLESLPPAEWQDSQRHRLRWQESAEEFCSPALFGTLVPGPVTFKKELEFRGCNVDFEAVEDAAWPVSDGDSCCCSGCARSLSVDNFFFDEDDVRLCRGCWAMGLMDAWVGCRDRHADESQECRPETPWKRSSQPNFITHPLARVISFFKDDYDNTMSVHHCPVCQHAWLEGLMK